MDNIANKGKQTRRKSYIEDQKLRKVFLFLGLGGATTIGSPSARGSGTTVVTEASTAATEAVGEKK